MAAESADDGATPRSEGLREESMPWSGRLALRIMVSPVACVSVIDLWPDSVQGDCDRRVPDADCPRCEHDDKNIAIGIAVLRIRRYRGLDRVAGVAICLDRASDDVKKISAPAP
jgi:hypothetical protein